MIKDTKYLITSIGLLSVLTMALIPGGISIQADDVKFYGAAELVLYDIKGNEEFRQTVHNQLVDSGETFLLEAAFQDGTAYADDVSIGSICVSDAATPTIGETEAASDFDGDNGLTTTNCEEDTTVTLASGVATIGPLTFTAVTGNNNVPAGTVITAIGICQNDTTDDGAFTDCATEGILFAVVDTSDVTLASGETVDITYTFDISSSTT